MEKITNNSRRNAAGGGEVKDYKRLTEQNIELLRKGEWRIQKTGDCQICSVFSDGDTYYVGEPIDRLAYYENAIESGELCDREELIDRLMTARDTSTLTDKEIEFFIKHNEKVRKETAREILKPLYNVIMEHSDCCVNLSEDIKFLMEKYGVDLEDEE